MFDRFPNQAARRKRVQHSQVTRFPDGVERKPDKSGTQATARRKRAGACTRDDWGNVRVGLFSESGERRLHTGGVRRNRQLIHKDSPLLRALRQAEEAWSAPLDAR